MRLPVVVTGGFLLAAASTLLIMSSVVNGFSIQDLQHYHKTQKGLPTTSSPHNNGLLLSSSSPRTPFRMETTRRDTIQMPSQTPMVPWKVSFDAFGLCSPCVQNVLLYTVEDVRVWMVDGTLSHSWCCSFFLLLFLSLGTRIQCGSIH